MSTEEIRVELGELLHQNITDSLPTDPTRKEIGAQVDTAIDIVLAAGYRRPRTVTTAAELAALPDMSVVRTNAGTIANLVGDNAYFFGYEKFAHRSVLALPATVLHEPEATK